jgi:ribosomal protein S18
MNSSNIIVKKKFQNPELIKKNIIQIQKKNMLTSKYYPSKISNQKSPISKVDIRKSASQPIFRKNQSKKLIKKGLENKDEKIVKIDDLDRTLQIAKNLKYLKDTSIKVKNKLTRAQQDEIYSRQRSIKAAEKKRDAKKKSNKPKKSLRFILFLKREQKKQSQNHPKNEKKRIKNISYLNVKFLRAFLTQFGKIRSRYITRLKVSEQARISKLIRRARSSKIQKQILIPSTFKVFY